MKLVETLIVSTIDAEPFAICLRRQRMALPMDLVINALHHSHAEENSSAAAISLLQEEQANSERP